MSLARKFVTTYRVMSLRDFVRKILRFIFTRLQLLLARFHSTARQEQLVAKILTYQSNDKYSLEFNPFIARMLLEVKPEVLIVPNFLKSVFKLSVGSLIPVDILAYVDLTTNDPHLKKKALVILHDPMVNQLSKVKNELTEFEAVFQIPGYSVISNFKLVNYPVLSSYSDLLQKVEHSHEKHKMVDAFNFKLKTRTGTMDEGIISEVNNEYITWINKNLAGKDLHTWVDLGGHIGAFSVMMSAYAGKGIVFEPLPDNYSLIQENIELNNLVDTIQAYPLAVSDKAGKAILHISSDNTGGNRLHVGDPSSTESVEVEVTTLENILADHHIDCLDLLKVDVEGSEQKILFPSKAILAKRVKYIICEAGGSLYGDGMDVLDFLREIGFDVEYTGNAGLMIIYGKNLGLTG